MVSHEKVKVSLLPLPAAASVMEVIVSTADEITIDELAARVGMTVRNVRAYAGRGLIPAPRLQGRTGYYGAEHVSRLRLIRELVDRGYTLAAVEKAFASQSESTAVHALDLLAVLDAPLGQESAEVMLRDSLPMLTGSGPGTGTDVVDDLVRLGRDRGARRRPQQRAPPLGRARRHLGDCTGVVPIDGHVADAAAQ